MGESITWDLARSHSLTQVISAAEETELGQDIRFYWQNWPQWKTGSWGTVLLPMLCYLGDSVNLGSNVDYKGVQEYTLPLGVKKGGLKFIRWHVIPKVLSPKCFGLGSDNSLSIHLNSCSDLISSWWSTIPSDLPPSLSHLNRSKSTNLVQRELVHRSKTEVGTSLLVTKFISISKRQEFSFQNIDSARTKSHHGGSPLKILFSPGLL